MKPASRRSRARRSARPAKGIFACRMRTRSRTWVSPSNASETGCARAPPPLYLPVGRQSARTALHADPVDDQADDVGRELLRFASTRERIAPGPRVQQVEQRLRGERGVHLSQLAGVDAVVQDLLQGREEVTEEGAARLAVLVDGERDPAVSQQAWRAAARADEVRQCRDETLA